VRRRGMEDVEHGRYRQSMLRIQWRTGLFVGEVLFVKTKFFNIILPFKIEMLRFHTLYSKR